MSKGLWITSVILWAGLASAGGLDPGLAVRLSGMSPGEELAVIVHLRAQADLALFRPDQKPQMVSELHRVAEATQPALLSRFEGELRNVGRFWIYNGFVCTATKDAILDLTRDPAVEYVCENATVRLADYEEAPGVNTIEWNIRKVRADSVWRLRGYTGQGVVLGIIDTGVEVSHPAFGSRWRQQDGWFDAINGQSTPYDDNGHGTFAMGIAVGAGGVDTIGVAPQAQFIAAKGLSAGGSGSYAQLTACLQWYASLCSLGRGPVAVINAWGGGRTDTQLWQPCRNLQVLGVSLAFSVGGGGPGPGTVAAPGNYPSLFGLGATDASDVIGSFSARGPAPTGYPWDSTASWLDPLWGTRTPQNHIKPDLVAPGVNIRSSYRGGGYTTMSGTSWGPPHLAGAIALIKQKNPTLTPTQLWQLITSTCDTLVGGPFPNQTYGWGRLNCLRAVDAAPSGVEDEAFPFPREDLSLSVSPNPMRERCEFRLGSAQGATSTVRLYEATGRLVRSLSGKGSLLWDGRDEGGRPAASGVYFASREGKARSSVRVVVTR